MPPASFAFTARVSPGAQNRSVPPALTRLVLAQAGRVGPSVPIITARVASGSPATAGALSAGGAGWLHAKLGLVALLVAYHAWCGKLMMDFRRDRNTRSHVWFRWFNEFPVLVLVGAVLLVVYKPQ